MIKLGSGIGRLADWLFRNTELKPENYEMVDFGYGQRRLFVKKQIHLLAQHGQLRLRRENLFTYNFGKRKYGHIWRPKAFLPQPIPKPEA